MRDRQDPTPELSPERRALEELREACRSARLDVIANERAFHRATGARHTLLLLRDLGLLTEEGAVMVSTWIRGGGGQLEYRGVPLVPPANL